MNLDTQKYNLFLYSLSRAMYKATAMDTVMLS
jgi:hypothetical protein